MTKIVAHLAFSLICRLIWVYYRNIFVDDSSYAHHMGIAVTSAPLHKTLYIIFLLWVDYFYVPISGYMFGALFFDTFVVHAFISRTYHFDAFIKLLVSMVFDYSYDYFNPKELLPAIKQTPARKPKPKSRSRRQISRGRAHYVYLSQPPPPNNNPYQTPVPQTQPIQPSVIAPSLVNVDALDPVIVLPKRQSGTIVEKKEGARKKHKKARFDNRIDDDDSSDELSPGQYQLAKERRNKKSHSHRKHRR